jgi:hypothetical protein
MQRTVVLLGLAAVLLLGGVAMANGPPVLERYVIGSGGGQAAAEPYAVEVTLGQPVVGVGVPGAYGLCAGYWCGVAKVYEVYLPLVVRTAG